MLPGLDQEGVERHPERARGRRPRQSPAAYLVNHQQEPRAISQRRWRLRRQGGWNVEGDPNCVGHPDEHSPEARCGNGRPFGVDVAFAEPIVGEPDTLQGAPWLEFAGIAVTVVRAYPVATHVAEKLHAFTLPRPTPNSRVKDLPDIAILGTIRALTSAELRAAIDSTFRHRGTHPVPAALPDAPLAWAAPYADLARRDGLAWTDLETVTAAARAFVDPVLANACEVAWTPGEGWR
ncbi:MAG: nucleotidyl transferase AbiEii/AbiGii toxin family protein [Pseudomonadota bacterium]|nr:nucleotidyl transferase AbiEii/AbiGii toxin family protein [Pseudomonadota bacterium]